MRSLLFLLFSLSLFRLISQVPGCTDPLATNFNSLATQNDGSCVYNAASISPTFTFSLSDSLKETSGLIRWGNCLYTHNDDIDKGIYKLDTGGIKLQTYTLNLTNKNWEEISQDSNYIYIGDFGNNSGNRLDLRIFRISKSSLTTGPVIDVINFSYSNQTSFSVALNNNDFDCEAFVVTVDSIFLFTKRWASGGTGVYSLPKTPGTYSANLKTIISTPGLITAASMIENKKLILLTGYTGFLQPFIFLLYDYQGTNFGGGNKRQIDVSLPFHQIEGISMIHPSRCYVSNELYSNSSFTVTQKLSVLDLSPYLNSYINPLSAGTIEFDPTEDLILYPNPAEDFLFVNSEEEVTVQVSNIYSDDSRSFSLSRKQGLDLRGFKVGVYILRIGSKRLKFIKH